MADLARFETASGKDVVIDLESIIMICDGHNSGCTVFHIIGLDEPIEVVAEFKTLLDNWFSYYDCRQKQKKPRAEHPRLP